MKKLHSLAESIAMRLNCLLLTKRQRSGRTIECEQLLASERTLMSAGSLVLIPIKEPNVMLLVGNENKEDSVSISEDARDEHVGVAARKALGCTELKAFASLI